MKMKRNKPLKNKLLKLQALKLHSKRNIKVDKNFTHIRSYLNKIFNIVYKYHKANKKILFLGFPFNFRHTLKNTKHKVIPRFLYFHGLLSKQESIHEVNKKKLKKFSLSTLKLLLKIKKIDLVVIYSQRNEAITIQESYSKQIPTITISKKKLYLNNKITYQSLGNFGLLSEKSGNSNFFLSFLKTVLTKTK
jgi:ribosomal protein S2